MSADQLSMEHLGPSIALVLAGKEQAEEKSKSLYYVYLHRYKTGPKKGQIFYVGKGKGARKDKRNSGRNNHWKAIVQKYDFYSEVIFQSHDEDQCLRIEHCIIKKIGFENLANKAVGGRKNSGWKHSEEWKQKASRERSGVNHPLYRVPMSEEQKRKISETLTGRPSPLKGIPNGKKWSEDTRRKIAKLREFNDERNPWFHSWKKSEETKKKLSRPVETVCGMKFYGMSHAAEWLRSNGWPSACHGPISLCCDPESKRVSAYGYVWRYSDGTKD